MYATNTCTLCPKGRETKVASGAAACTACIPGSTLLATTDLNCTACAPGEYADKQGFSGACKKCPLGYAVPDEGQQRLRHLRPRHLPGRGRPAGLQGLPRGLPTPR